MSRLRADRGMTLMEMLIAMVITMIVSLACFALIEVTMRRSSDISARVDTTQRGRGAMDTITRQIRSQVCVQRSDDATMVDDRAVYAATPTAIAFFTDLGDDSVHAGNAIKPPQLHSLSFESGKLIERDYASTGSTVVLGITKYAYGGYPSAPTLTRTVLTDVANTLGTTSAPVFFTYFKFTPATATVPAAPTTTLSASGGMVVADLQQVAKISVSYRAMRYKGTATDRGNTIYASDVYVRSADPNSQTPKPVCA